MKMFRKGMSLIIALALVIAMLPAYTVGAAGVDQEFLFGTDITSFVKNTTTTSLVTLDATNKVLTNTLIRAGYMKIAPRPGNNVGSITFVAVPVKINNAGTYQLHFKAYDVQTYSSDAEIFVVKASDVNVTAEKTSLNTFIGTNQDGDGRFNFSTAQEGTYAAVVNNGTPAEMDLEATDYWVVISLDAESLTNNPMILDRTQEPDAVVSYTTMPESNTTNNYVQQWGLSGIKLVAVDNEPADPDVPVVPEEPEVPVEDGAQIVPISAENVYQNIGTSYNKLSVTDGTLSMTDMAMFAYGVQLTGANAPYFAIPFTAEESGTYEIKLKAADATKISADMAIHLVGEPETAPASFTVTPVTFIESYDDFKGRFNFSTATADEYGNVMNGAKTAKINLVKGTKYYLVFIADTESRTNNTWANYLLVPTDTSTVDLATDTYRTRYRQEAHLSGIKLVPVEMPGTAVQDTQVRFQASAYIGGTVSDSTVQAVSMGTPVTVEATANPGYTFAYWKNSAGMVLSTSARETFKVNTNTSVIAVFDAEEADENEIPVYFYNGNGLLLGDTTVAKDTTFEAAKGAAEVPETPTLTGFVFSHWSDKDKDIAIADNATITALTRAVAIYNDAATTYTVKVGETPVAENKKYGDTVTVYGGENFVCWKLGDKVISYEKNYTFDVYGDITLTEVTEGVAEKAPVLVLDKNAGNYFLTYDAADYELIEAGILFGNANASIESYNGYKATAKEGTGQFTAQPHDNSESTVARGYMIFRDDSDSVRVIYAD